MENEPLPYEEGLARLYLLQQQLDLDVMTAAENGELSELDDGGPCEDCRQRYSMVRYGRLDLCRVCAITRIVVRRRLEPAG